MPHAAYTEDFKQRVAFRHRLHELIHICMKDYQDETLIKDRTGQMLGLSDLLMEECFLLAGEIEMSDHKEYYMTCDSHGRKVACYCVCIHVANQGAKPVYHDLATPTNIGSICCQQCLDLPDTLTVDDAVLVCANCALLNGYIPGTIQ